jgi:hypothetical protein
MNQHRIKPTSKGNSFVINKQLAKTMKHLSKCINKHSNLPAQLLSTLPLKAPQDAQYIRNFMSHDYYTDDYCIRYSGYPTDESSSHLTTIEITGGTYNVLGIKIGTSKEEAFKILNEFNFKPTKNKSYSYNNYTDNDDAFGFVNAEISVCIVTKNDIVTTILLEAKTYYLGNRLY